MNLNLSKRPSELIDFEIIPANFTFPETSFNSNKKYDVKADGMNFPSEGFIMLMDCSGVKNWLKKETFFCRLVCPNGVRIGSGGLFPVL